MLSPKACTERGSIGFQDYPHGALVGGSAIDLDFPPDPLPRAAVPLRFPVAPPPRCPAALVPGSPLSVRGASGPFRPLGPSLPRDFGGR
jgi:hypothetical protein